VSYKALCLDFYGTLVHEDDAIIAEILKDIAATSLISLDTRRIGKDWYARFLELTAVAYGDHFKRQREIEIESSVSNQWCKLR
jgi:hypothetical protein